MASLNSNYVLENIKLLDDDSITIESLVDKMCIQICEDYNVQRTDELENAIRSILTKYKEKTISSDDVITFFNEMDVNSLTETTTEPPTDTPTETPSTGSGSSSGKKDKTTTTQDSENNEDQSTDTTDQESENTGNDQSSSTGTQSDTTSTTTQDTTGIIDVDTEKIEKVSATLSEVEEEASSNDISVPASVAEYAAEIQALVKTGNIEISTGFDRIKTEMAEKLQSVIDADDSIENQDVVADSFASIWSTAHNINLTKLVPADASFFAQNPDCKIEGTKVTFKKDGNTYTYDLKTKRFTMNGSGINNVGIYVPSGATDYSKLNTFTYFVADGYDNTTKYPSNAIVVRLLKSTVQSSGKFTKATEVAGATKFVNGVAKTDKTNCQNVIGGDSVYGAYSLKLAATNGSLYDTVYCVNNCALVTGMNATRGSKAQFATLDDLKKLDGKNIYFISATGDPNLASHYGNKGAMTPCPYNQSYTYTGAEIVSKYCPNANVYAVYGGTEAKDGIKRLYRNLDRKYSNFTYLENEWNNMVKGNYHSHSDGAKLMSDLVGAVPTNYNNYNA